MNAYYKSVLDDIKTHNDAVAAEVEARRELLGDAAAERYHDAHAWGPRMQRFYAAQKTEAAQKAEKERTDRDYLERLLNDGGSWFEQAD
jgi:hypothetical protein